MELQVRVESVPEQAEPDVDPDERVILEALRELVVTEEDLWTCHLCTYRNQNGAVRCEMCDAASEAVWTCVRCTMANSTDTSRCDMCGSARNGEAPPWIEEVKAEEKFYCGICMDDVVESNKCSLACEHDYCCDCVRSFVSLEIKEARVLNINCPG